MTKKDFELIAGVLYDARMILTNGDPDANHAAWEDILALFILRLASTNSLFSAVKFAKYARTGGY